MSGQKARKVTTRTSQPYIAVIALCACAFLLAGCVRLSAPDSPAPSASMVIPTPDGWSAAGGPIDLDDSDSCNATASLRPGPLPPPNRMPPNTSLSAIQNRGVLIVGADVGSNLFSFRDPATGDIQGFDVDIAREMARAIFGDPRRVEFRILSSAERVSALQSGNVDLVVKTMTITCQRLRDVAFSTVYFQAAQRILALRRSPIADVADLAGKRVCSARGSISTGRVQRLAPNARIYTAATWADCLVALQQDQADAISTDDAILAGLAAQDPYVHVVGSSLGTEPYGIGINKNRPDLVRFVNGVLAQMRQDGQWYEIYNRWLSILGPANYPPQPTYRD